MHLEAANAMGISPPSPAPAVTMASQAGEDTVGDAPQAPLAAAQDNTGGDPSGSSSARGRFSQEQIRAILEEQFSGTPIAEVCRRHGISTTTFFRWRKRYESEVSVPVEESRVRHLEEENRQLKILLAEAVLENAIIRESAGLGRLFGKK